MSRCSSAPENTLPVKPTLISPARCVGDFIVKRGTADRYGVCLAQVALRTDADIRRGMVHAAPAGLIGIRECLVAIAVDQVQRLRRKIEVAAIRAEVRPMQRASLDVCRAGERARRCLRSPDRTRRSRRCRYRRCHSGAPRPSGSISSREASRTCSPRAATVSASRSRTT
jgi:hypothetical protein